MSAPLRVVLVDDHAVVRTGIRSMLERIAVVVVAGEARDGQEAVELVERLRPHVVFMDITMPGMNGLEATRRIVAAHPATHVIIVSMHASEEYAVEALRAGAAGYLLKDADEPELHQAIDAVMRGQTYLTPAVSTHVVADYRRRLRDLPSPPQARLTPRQREILQLIAEGQTTKQIAARLVLSVKTVENHRAELMKRLGIHDVAGLVRFAIRSGFI